MAPSLLLHDWTIAINFSYNIFYVLYSAAVTDGDIDYRLNTDSDFIFILFFSVSHLWETQGIKG